VQSTVKSDHPAIDVIKIAQKLLRGLSREQAAHYIGVGVGLFDDMVKDGRMPQPICINRRKVWDVRELDEHFDALKDQPQANPWDDD
jgi:predicted DNA-binding transcriptional regulator AlpA